MFLTVDSSVIIASLRKQEEKHLVCKALMERIVEGEHVGVMPFTVFVEVISAIRRRTGDSVLAERVEKDLENIDTIHFLDVNKSRSKEAAAITRVSGLRGMDVLVVQVAKEHASVLITLDNELAEAAQGIVKISPVEDVR